MKCTKGIILAGGTGSRLYPLTMTVNKQLLPVYDKPTIYYPLTTLMFAGIRDILIISSPHDLPAIEKLLGNGNHFGLKIQYKVQEKPRGLPEAFILAEDFIKGEPVAMILGDNLFYGQGFSSLVQEAAQNVDTAHVFLYTVKDPARYGVAKFKNDKLADVVEKPKEFISPWAVTGLYFFPASVTAHAKNLKPSARGELEITDLIRHYMKEDSIKAHKLGRGNIWLDIGTPEALLQAANLIEVLQNRQNLLIASPEEIAWRMSWLSLDQYKAAIESIPQCSYRSSLEITLAA